MPLMRGRRVLLRDERVRGSSTRRAAKAVCPRVSRIERVPGDSGLATYSVNFDS